MFRSCRPKLPVLVIRHILHLASVRGERIATDFEFISPASLVLTAMRRLRRTGMVPGAYSHVLTRMIRPVHPRKWCRPFVPLPVRRAPFRSTAIRLYFSRAFPVGAFTVASASAHPCAVWCALLFARNPVDLATGIFHLSCRWREAEHKQEIEDAIDAATALLPCLDTAMFGTVTFRHMLDAAQEQRE